MWVPRPWDRDRRDVTYPNISLSGTRAERRLPSLRRSTEVTRPRRALMSPITPPRNSSGTVMSTAITGSRRYGFPFSYAERNALTAAPFAASGVAGPWRTPTCAAPPALPPQPPFRGPRLGDRSPVDGLRHPGPDGEPEIPAQTVHQDLEVQFPHPGQDDLAGVRVLLHRQRRILLHHLRERLPEAVHLPERPGLHHDRHHRFPDLDRLEEDRRLRIGQRAPRPRLSDPPDRHDVPR